MANGFGSFYVGSSGLKNSQNALNTTALCAPAGKIFRQTLYHQK